MSAVQTTLYKLVTYTVFKPIDNMGVGKMPDKTEGSCKRA